MANGASSRLLTSIVCPKPPRAVPGPPESVRNSFFQMTIGVIASVISTGTFLTPLGKGVADKPSRAGRAPAPPEWKLVTMKAVWLSVPLPLRP